MTTTPAAAASINAEREADRTNWVAVYGMAFCSFVLVASEFMPVSLLSPIASDLHLSEGQAGQAISVCAFAALATSLCVSRVIGTMDRRHVLLVLIGMLVASTILAATAPNFTVLLLGRLFVGAAVGGFWSLSAATVMRLVPTKSVPVALAVLNGGVAVASTLGAPIGSFVGGLLGWRGAFLFMLPLSIAAIAWIALALPGLPAQHRSGPRSMLGLLRKPGVAVGYAAAMLFFAGQFFLYTYLRPFLEQVTHAGVELVSAMLLLIGVMGFIGTVVIGRAIGRRLHVTLAVLPALMAIVALCLAVFGSSMIATVALLAIWGFVGTAAPVVWWTWVTRATAEDVETGGGLMVAAAQIGILSGAAFGGVAYDHFGPIVTVLGSGLILIVAALAAFAIGSRQGSVEQSALREA